MILPRAVFTLDIMAEDFELVSGARVKRSNDTSGQEGRKLKAKPEGYSEMKTTPK